MSTISIYSNANNSTRTVSFEFVGDLLAASDSVYYPSNAASFEYYFKITAGATQDNNLSFQPKIVRKLSDLALNRQKQSQSNVGTAYGDIKTMIVDYTYDFVNGHTNNQFSSGCTEQRPMKFT